jgi:deoxyribonuclease-4
MRYIGTHVSIAGGINRALERARRLDINAVQIFLKNSNRWKSRLYTAVERDDFLSMKKAFGDIKIFAHSGYLINLAGGGENLRKSINSMVDEINRAELLGIEYLVVHPGSHKGRGEIEGIKRIARSIDMIYRERNGSDVKILLETTSGMGTSIGYRFEHLRDIIDLSRNHEKLFICLDTCHIFAAGYDISDSEVYDAVVEDLDRIVGIDRLKLIHLNDSKGSLACRVDRHEHIGDGFIGDSGFRILLNDKRMSVIPMILETPKFNEFEADMMNLKKVYELIAG